MDVWMAELANARAVQNSRFNGCVSLSCARERPSRPFRDE